MVGGTSVEVAREMGIEAHGLDLHSGFNILEQRILDVVGKPSDLVLSHPPYHNIIVYSGNVWGRGRILTICADAEAGIADGANQGTAQRRQEQQGLFAKASAHYARICHPLGEATHGHGRAAKA